MNNNYKKISRGDSSQQTIIRKLIEFALHIGATKVKCLHPSIVSVENKLAGFCEEPKCPHWGQSMSCPPHISGPDGLREILRSCKYVLVLRIEIQSESLHGADRPEVMRLLHEITAEVEKEAIRLGFTKAMGLAGGSCKPSFCHDQLHCRVLEEQGECRHPEHARQSMSGYGVDVGKLMQAAGWSTNLFTTSDENGDEQLSWVAGLVLLR